MPALPVANRYITFYRIGQDFRRLEDNELLNFQSTEKKELNGFFSRLTTEGRKKLKGIQQFGDGLPAIINALLSQASLFPPLSYLSIYYATPKKADIKKLLDSDIIDTLHTLCFIQNDLDLSTLSLLLQHKKTNNLRILDLSLNPLSAKAIQQLSSAASLASVQSLNLSSTDLEESSLQTLYSSPLCESLLGLDLSHNYNLSPSALAPLFELPQFSTLKALALPSGYNPGDLLARKLAANQSLQFRYLDIRASCFHPDTLVKILRAPALAQIEEIILNNNPSSPDVIDALCALKNLERIDYEDASLTDEDASRLRAALPKLNHLKYSTHDYE